MHVVIGPGDFCGAQDLYRGAILGEVVLMRREGAYVYMGSLMQRMSNYNQEILWGMLWAIALEGKLA